MYNELNSEFKGLRVVDFENPKNWEGPQVAYRLREEYDDQRKIADRLGDLLKQSDCNKLTTLIVGAWSGACEGGDAAEIVADLAKSGPSLPELRHLFLGEMTYEECELSWINHSDVTPILNAFPRLESFRVRGGAGLSFSKTRHESLKELAIESGGLSSSTIREIFQCEFPSLEHLELLLGEENYGFDGGVEDLQPLFAGKLFPKLKFLGLMNSTIANDIAAVLVNSPIVGRIESLDLSMGNLSDEGVRSLRGLAGHKQLQRLNITHHYASEAAVADLTRTLLSTEVLADDRKDPEDEWRPILHAE